jgi:hypothetical protein
LDKICGPSSPEESSSILPREEENPEVSLYDPHEENQASRWGRTPEVSLSDPHEENQDLPMRKNLGSVPL